ncbi:hypothetical protein JI735_34255 (plasmid) [Paenibacillus sonchi]|uniref:Uncharacterized protein n=1 Tax=Paenibacillus sonchi TaxID=373687 RepID=A0A974PIA8_9BACL|nr:hypothetical protein [Paenibacillus sonchi]QQZ64504.1 hypothetical protein JI735_34255 [Paenibacillus sonchi]
MAKARYQVSSDKGATWKCRWIDRTNFDPRKSVLKPGDYIQTPKGTVVVSIIEGKLSSAPIDDTFLVEYRYTFEGEVFSIIASSDSEADYFFAQELLNKGIVVRTEIGTLENK